LNSVFNTVYVLGIKVISPVKYGFTIIVGSVF